MEQRQPVVHFENYLRMLAKSTGSQVKAPMVDTVYW